ncbi:unnamed protein product [Rotaria sp. Silwood1]|nr:unnamed protein product [Rotaria sp. Silwood1]CAF1669588.1 unnamed protein product [Rotaria sp. Silwood1]
MYQNEHNTVILDAANSRFLFYDNKTQGSNKYDLYDVNILDKSDEIFEKQKISEKNSILSLLKEQNEQQQQKGSIVKDALDDSNTTIINNMDLFIIDAEQSQTRKINYNKTILESDDNDSNRPTFDDIIKLDDESFFVVGELEDDEIDDNNKHQQEVLFDINDKNENNESNNNNKTNISINNNILENKWSTYADICKKPSLKPKSIEINLLGFGCMEKATFKKKLHSIQSPTSLFVHNTNNYRSSYVSQCKKNYGKPLTHVLVFEGTTSPVYFDTELFKEITSSSSSISSDKKIISMKMLLRKLLQLERIIFFLSFYYKIELSQFFSGLICFHFYHNSHIDTSLMLKNIMSSQFSQAIPLLFRLYSIDQFILTY